MDRSPLNRLPAELRNQIAELVLHHEDGFCIIHEDSKNFKLQACSNTPTHPQALALTCKQLHYEYMQLFYSLNDFKVECKDGRIVDPAAAFLRKIGPHNAAACKLVILRNVGICGFNDSDLTLSREVAHPSHFRYAFDSVMMNIRNNETFEAAVDECYSMHLTSVSVRSVSALTLSDLIVAI